jgi:hypothetical protein
MGRQTLTIIFSLVILAIGYAMYANSALHYDQCKSTIADLAQAFSISAAVHCNTISIQHFTSIGIMGVGAVVFLIGLFVPGRRSR